MKKQSFTVRTVFDTRKMKDEIAPVKLCLTYQRKQFYLTIRDEFNKGIWMSQKDFSKLGDKRVSKELTIMRRQINTYEAKGHEIMESIISTFETFDFEKFKEELYKSLKKSASNNLIELLNNKAIACKKQGRISTAVSYECAKNSLKSFVKCDVLSLSDCTPKFFSEYEKWMRKNGKSIATVGVYLRNVRAIFNENIRLGNLRYDIYPFSSQKYDIPSENKPKTSLTLDQIKKIIDYDFKKHRKNNFYKSLWLFSYLCNGLSVKEIALIKPENVKKDVLIIQGDKSNNSSLKSNTRKIILNSLAKEIIAKYGNKNADYLFSILNNKMNEVKKYNALQQIVKKINNTMKRISIILELPKITTFTAKNSFASVLTSSGAGLDFMSKSLGHSNIKTTEKFLSDFDEETKKKWSNKLLH